MQALFAYIPKKERIQSEKYSEDRSKRAIRKREAFIFNLGFLDTGKQDRQN